MKKLANEAQTPVTEKTDLKAQLAEVAERIRTMREIIGEKASAASHPARACGRQSWCEKRQRKNMQTALMSAM